MEFNSKKLKWISQIVNYSISIILCVFLILLFTSLHEELDKHLENVQYSLLSVDKTIKKAEELDSLFSKNIEELNSSLIEEEVVDKTTQRTKDINTELNRLLSEHIKEDSSLFSKTVDTTTQRTKDINTKLNSLLSKHIEELNSFKKACDKTIPKAEDTNTELDSLLSKHVEELNSLLSKKEAGEKKIATEKDLQNAKQSFDNWLQTRKTLGSQNKDQEVIERAKKIDKFYEDEQKWRTERNALQIQIDEKQKQKQEIQNSIDSIKKQEIQNSINNTKNSIDEIKEDVKDKSDGALKAYNWTMKLCRFIFLPLILALGIFFFIRYRQHKFYPLFFGFTLFSLYTFFFWFVPYLPSYVHYSIGVLLTVGLGYYAIKRIRQFIEQKKE